MRLNYAEVALDCGGKTFWVTQTQNIFVESCIMLYSILIRSSTKEVDSA